MTSVVGRFLRLHRNLKWLTPLFKQLDHIIENYVLWEEEPPYFNNEAASVSLLVAAGSRAGYIVLSDFRTDKIAKRKRKNGRCDLLVDKKNGPYLQIEAKQIYVRSRPGNKMLKSKLGRAYDESKQLLGSKPGKRAGLLFVILSLSKSEASQFELEDFEKKITSVKCDLCWMWYDKNWKKFLWEPNERYYPCFAVLIRK